MTIGANTYAEHERVETRISDVIVGGEFDATTRPTLDQAEELLDDVAASMNSLLLQHGYAAPIVEADDPIPFAEAVKVNAAEASVLVLNVYPVESFDPDVPEPMRNRLSSLHSEYKRWRTSVEEEVLVSTRTVKRTSRFVVGSARDRKTGAKKEPSFRRDMFDYPGTVVRVDSSE